MFDYKKTVESYLNVDDWRVKENSTVQYSLGGLILSNSGAITANYWLNDIYYKEIADAHKNADIHIHDLSMLASYCSGWSLRQLIQEGLGGVPGKISSTPASHLSTLCNQMVNFLGIVQNEGAGAQAFSSFDTYLAPFVKVDDLNYKQVKQCIQSFVFGINTPSRWGGQAPFTNVTLDWTVPADLAEQNCIVGGKELPFKYKDCQKEMDMVNKAFIEVMIEGDANGRGFQYPIPTYSITKDFDWSDTENNRLLFEMAAKYGTPYFSNYINSDMEPSDVRSMAILGSQDLIYKDKFGRISKNEVRHLVAQWNASEDTKYQVLMNGKFVDVIDMFEVPYEKYNTYVTIELANGVTQSFSYDHKCVIARDGKIQDCLAQEVTDKDYFLLAKHGYDESDIGTYESGKMVGYYLAEGWTVHNGAEIDFAINDNREDICKDIQNFFEKSFACRVAIDHWTDKHIFKVKVFSRAAAGFVKTFIDGDCAIKKRINVKAFDTSLAFRQGVYDGYLETDGSKCCNVFAHTTNKELCNDMVQLFATIGKYFRIETNNHNTRYFKPDKSDLVHFTSYKLYMYEPESFDDDYYRIKISSVKESYAHRINRVYNFTVDTDEHIYELPNGIITHQCCRLRLDLRELRKKSGGYFGSGESTGSIGVVTINMPRIGYLAEDKEDFYKRLDRMMDIAAMSLKIKRNVITKLLEDGLYPYTKRYLGTFNNHFSTIGLVGMNEACMNAKWLRMDMTHADAQEFAKEVLNHMRERLSDYQEQYGDLYNLEATPAESTAYRLAKHDVERYPDIITAARDSGSTPYYTNSTHLPVWFTDDVFSALDIQDELQTLYTSGTVFHAFLGEKLPDWKAAAHLVRKIAENYRLPYFTLSPTYSVCKNHGYISGEEYKCPSCGEETEVYSRITGYYRPVKNWNDGKAQEFKDRKEYVLNGLESTLNDQAAQLPINKKYQSGKVTVLATRACPNCKRVVKNLEELGVKFTEIFADDNVEPFKAYAIDHVPAIIIENDRETTILNSLSDINDYLKFRLENEGGPFAVPMKSAKIRVNPDADKVAEVRKALKENDGYCPCRPIKSEDTKCMCKEFKEQESGYCHCQLYYKE